MTDKALILTEPQNKAFKQLKAAFNKCGAVGLEIHGELTTLYAINAKGLDSRSVITGGENSIVSNDAESITPNSFKGCGADDGVGIE